MRWDAGLDGLGHEAEAALPGIRRQVGTRLGWGYDGPVDVALVRGHARAVHEVGSAVPEWAVGVATAPPPRVVIRVDLLERGWGSGLIEVLRHEWVHVVWRQWAGERRRLLPLWFEEGLAEEIGGGVSVDAGAALDVAVAFDRLLRFEDLRRSFPADARGADLAYKQSRSWVRYLVQKRGWRVVREILHDLATGVAESERLGRDPFAETVRRRTGLSLGEWHAAWRLDLEEDARPWFHLLFRDISWLLLMAVSLVAFLAFFFIARRRRRQIQRLPDEPDL